MVAQGNKRKINFLGVDHELQFEGGDLKSPNRDEALTRSVAIGSGFSLYLMDTVGADGIKTAAGKSNVDALNKTQIPFSVIYHV